MTDLTSLTLAEARDGLRTKAFSARDLAEAHIKAVEAARPLNAFIVETPEKALAGAAEADRRFAAGTARRLEGLPLGIKDLFCTRDVQATAGSHILEGFKPIYESTVTQNLWDAGATMLGKLNMDEFAMGSSNETSYFKPVAGARLEQGSGAGWFFRRVVGCGGGQAVPWRDGHGHRRLDPSARCGDRHRGDQAHLWPLFAMGDCGLCLLSRPGRANGADRARLRDPAARNGKPRPQGLNLGGYSGPGL